MYTRSELQSPVDGPQTHIPVTKDMETKLATTLQYRRRVSKNTHSSQHIALTLCRPSVQLRNLSVIAQGPTPEPRPQSLTG